MDPSITNPSQLVQNRFLDVWLVPANVIKSDRKRHFIFFDQGAESESARW